MAWPGTECMLEPRVDVWVGAVIEEEGDDGSGEKVSGS